MENLASFPTHGPHRLTEQVVCGHSVAAPGVEVA
jgi:hypothetical protein